MHNNDVLDLVGIGFGPAGIALAAAIQDSGEDRGINLKRRVTFYEQAATPGWQTGLLFRNVDIQHHYMRDLATPRNPRSRFTFANFLKEHDRIFEFGSLVYGGGGGAVSRIEWSNYVAWAASLLDEYVNYECPVEGMHLARAGEEQVIAVRSRKGEILTRAVAFCAGQELSYPALFRGHVGDRVFHATRFLHKMQKIPKTERLRVSVIGAGQSAIEIVSYLHANYPQAQITCLQRSFGFHHGNHSPFIQRMFHPKESDIFFALEPAKRKEVLRDIGRVNYGAVDREAVSALYRTLYEDDLLGTKRIRLLTGTEIIKVESDEGGSLRVSTSNKHDGSLETTVADIVVLATGFVKRSLPQLFDPLLSIMRLNVNGEPEVGYDFKVRTQANSDPLILVPGAAEASHGLGGANSFSMIAVKAERVMEALHSRGLLLHRQDQVRDDA